METAPKPIWPFDTSHPLPLSFNKVIIFSKNQPPIKVPNKNLDF
jgi:hypothetical protein